MERDRPCCRGAGATLKPDSLLSDLGAVFLHRFVQLFQLFQTDGQVTAGAVPLAFKLVQAQIPTFELPGNRPGERAKREPGAEQDRRSRQEQIEGILAGFRQYSPILAGLTLWSG